MPPRTPTNSCCRSRKQPAPAAVCQHPQHHANNHKTKEKKAFIICVIHVRVLTPACRPTALQPVWKERSWRAPLPLISSPQTHTRWPPNYITRDRRRAIGAAAGRGRGIRCQWTDTITGVTACAPCGWGGGSCHQVPRYIYIFYTVRIKVFPLWEVYQWPWNVGSLDFITWRRNVCVVKYCKHCKGLLPRMMWPKSNISWRENCAPRATFSFRDNKK